MNIDNLTLGDVKQLQCMLNGDNKKMICKDFGWRIVVLQRGWVAVGKYHQDGEYVNLTNAYIIRRWGTTEGLPELAIKGELDNTTLDKSPDIRFHALTEVMSIDCSEEKWKDK